MSKKLMIPALFAVASLAWSEPQRVFLTTENKFPETGKLELGYDYTGREYETLKFTSHSAVARLGLVENLTARVQAPFVNHEPDFGDSESGVGDVVLGLDLVAYQDVFSFPFVIPHLDVAFPTGDEEKGLGSGDTLVKFGVSIGTKTHEQFVWVADFSYASAYDAKASEQDDQFDIALSWLWELSDQFTFNLEGLVRRMESYDSSSVLLGGGMTYKWTPALQSGVYFGAWNSNDSGEDQLLKISASYAF